MALQMTKDLFEVLSKKKKKEIPPGERFIHIITAICFLVMFSPSKPSLIFVISFFLISFHKIPLFCWYREQGLTHGLLVLCWVNTPRPSKYDSEPSTVQKE